VEGEARIFAPLDNVMENPAMGSAAVALRAFFGVEFGGGGCGGGDDG